MTNIVLFSSGVSEKNGTLDEISSSLRKRGYSCSMWRDLFATAHNADKIALLPMLIKKIPTFDYAVLICEGHDVTTMERDGDRENVRTMRDNVLFEIGLCTMALGLDKTIIVADDAVRLPEDLMGVSGESAVTKILLGSENGEYCDDNGTLNGERIGKEIDEYIKLSSDITHQVVIGAASSTACGYVSNFLCRTLEHIDEEILVDGRVITVSPEKVFIHIYLPEESGAKFYRDGLLKASVTAARDRPADFDCYFNGDEMHIVDVPTNTTTAYDTAKMILEMDADDDFDPDAEKRFTSKELKLYKNTLTALINRKYISEIINRHYAKDDDGRKEKMIEKVMDILQNRLFISYF